MLAIGRKVLMVRTHDREEYFSRIYAVNSVVDLAERVCAGAIACHARRDGGGPASTDTMMLASIAQRIDRTKLF
jgi:hypothetical protein